MTHDGTAVAGKRSTAPSVSFGLYLENLHPRGEDLHQRLREHREQIALARDAGFTSLVIGHHVLTQPIQMLSPLPHLASLTDCSGTMKLCTGVLLLPLLNPVLLAEDLATLDWLCGGRLIVGVGLGYRTVEYKVAAIEPADRVSRFTEAVEIMRRVWSAGANTWSFEGKWHTFEGMPGGLEPCQGSGLLFWVAADADKAVRRAGRLGAAWYINPRATLAHLRRQLPLYLDALAAHDYARPACFPIRREAFIAPTDSEARTMAVRYLRRQLELYRSWGQYDIMPDADVREIEITEETIPDTYLVGTPEHVAELIGEYTSALDVNHFVLRMQWPGTPQSLVMRSIEYVGGTLVPLFHGQAPAAP